MPEKLVQLNEEVIKGQLKEFVPGSVEETARERAKAVVEELRSRKLKEAAKKVEDASIAV